MSKWVGVGGSWKPVTNMWVGVGGAWKQIEQKWIGVGGAWKLAYSALSASVSATVSGSAVGVTPTGYVSTTGDSADLSVTGGSGNYTYQWYLRSIVAGVEAEITGSTTADPLWFYSGVADGVQSHTVWYCRVTDATYGNYIDTDDIDVYLTYTDIS